MTLDSGAHVSFTIGSSEYQFQLDETLSTQLRLSSGVYGIPRPYSHFWDPLTSPRVDIPGSPGKESIDPNFRLWGLDDWSGGEGNNAFDERNPTVYYQGSGNPRIAGQLTSRPAKSTASVTVETSGYGTHFASGIGKAWIGAAGKAFRSTDSVTWTTVSLTSLGAWTGSYKASAIVGDIGYLYVAGSTSSGKASTGNRLIVAVDDSDVVSTVVSEVASFRRYFGIARLDNFLYGFNGRKFEEFDLNSTWPITRSASNIVNGGDLGPEAIPSDNNFWADVKAGENSVYYFHSVLGETVVYEYKSVDVLTKASRPIWRLPRGFTGKSFEIVNGYCIVGGNYEDAQSGSFGVGAIFAMDLQTRERQEVATLRLGTNHLNLQEMSAGHGNQVLIGNASTGLVYVLDTSSWAVSLLDDVDDCLAVGAYKNRRFIVDSTTNVNVYKTDAKQERATGTAADYQVDSGFYDFRLPYEDKMLWGFSVVFDPLVAGQHIKVYYQIDESGTYTQAGSTINTSNYAAGAALGRVFLNVSNSTTYVKYRLLRVRIVGQADNGVLYPVVSRVTPWGLPGGAAGSSIEGWQLALRIKDEDTFNHVDTQLPRRASTLATVTREASADEVRDALLKVIRNGTPVIFKDGYTFRKPGRYNTYDPVVLRPVGDHITRDASGTMIVQVLRLDRAANTDAPSTSN